MAQPQTGAAGATEHRRTGEQTIVHRREFEATAEAVQRAHVEAPLFTRWMGPVGTTVRIDTFEAVTGGRFRYVVEAPSGGSWAFRGSYHEVAPGRIVHTWEFEGESGVSLESLRFTDLADRRSVLEITSTFPSKEACDAMVESDLDSGMDEDLDRLDTVLRSLG